MADIADRFLSAAADPQVAALAADGRPAFLFERSGTAVIWANAAGAAYLGATSLADLLARRFADNSPFARRISALAGQISTGQTRTERIALPKGPIPRPVVCRASRAIVGSDRSVVLLVVDGTGRIPDADAAPRYAALTAALRPSEPADVTPSESAAIPMPEAEPTADRPAADRPAADRDVTPTVLVEAPPVPDPGGMETIEPPGDFEAAFLSSGEEERVPVEDEETATEAVEVADLLRLDGLSEVSSAEEADADAEGELAPEAWNREINAAEDVDLHVAPPIDAAAVDEAGLAPIGDPGEDEPDDDAPASPESLTEDAALPAEAAAEPVPPVEENAPFSEPQVVGETDAAPATIAELPAEDRAAVRVAEDGFVPPGHGRSVRFVFELDPDLVFNFISPELADTVGPRAADFTGEPWATAAELLHLDPNGRVSTALGQRDTFTGVTVDWPVQDQPLRIPVSLAGMPVFGRDRSFKGYRGFGIAHSGAAFAADLVVGGGMASLVPDAVAETNLAVLGDDGDRPAAGISLDPGPGETDRHEAPASAGEVPVASVRDTDTDVPPSSPEALALAEGIDPVVPAAAAETNLAVLGDDGQRPSGATLADPDADEAAREEAPALIEDVATVVVHDAEAGPEAPTPEAVVETDLGRDWPAPETVESTGEPEEAAAPEPDGTVAGEAAETAPALVDEIEPVVVVDEPEPAPPAAERIEDDLGSDWCDPETALDAGTAAPPGIEPDPTETPAAPSADPVPASPTAPAEVPQRDVPAGEPGTPPETPAPLPPEHPDPAPDEMPSPDRGPVEAPQQVPDEAPPALPEEMPGERPEDAPQDLPTESPGSMPDEMPGTMPDELPPAMTAWAYGAAEAAAAAERAHFGWTEIRETRAGDGDFVRAETAALSEILDDFAPDPAAEDVSAAEDASVPEYAANDVDALPAGRFGEGDLADALPDDAAPASMEEDGDLPEAAADDPDEDARPFAALASEVAEPDAEGPRADEPSRETTDISSAEGPAPAAAEDGVLDANAPPEDETELGIVEGRSEAEDVAWEEVNARSGEVIASPIVPRPVPQTTLSAEEASRRQLSRPEREAFLKIAEALGARVDGEPLEPAIFADPLSFASGAEATSAEAAEEPDAPPLPALDMGLLDKLPLAIAILKDGEAVRVNRAFLDLAGYESLAALSEAGGFTEAFAGSSLPRDTSAPAVRRRDGVEIPVRARLHSVPWGDEIASLMVLQEVAETTGRERAEVAEQRVEELEAILDTATDGVLVLDASGVIVGANRSAEALFGSPRAAMVGQPLIELLAPESHRGALDYLDGLGRNGLSSVLNDGREVIGRVAQGGLVPLFMTIGRVSPQKFCAVLRDITQWKRAEEELTNAKRSAENASSQKSDFLAKISHEIRTPLNAIIGFSEVMMEERFGPVGSDRYKEYLRDIHVSGAHIMSLVNDLLDLSKIEAGKLDLSFEAVPLNEIVRECVALMQPQANRERIIIRTSLSSTLPNVVADSRSLRQIVLNLVSNAVKFNAAGGQVIVSTLYEDTGEVAFRVRDTGPGMSEEDVAKALEPFRQLHTARPGRGTGLGLPLTKALVEANRAAFRIDSAVGQGTLVQITFPSTRVLAE